LDKMSTKNKLNILKKTEVRIEGLLTYQDMAGKLMKSISWVRHTCKSLGLKHSRVVDKVRYFEKDLVDRLAEHLDIVSERPDRKRENKKR